MSQFRIKRDVLAAQIHISLNWTRINWTKGNVLICWTYKCTPLIQLMWNKLCTNDIHPKRLDGIQLTQILKFHGNLKICCYIEPDIALQLEDGYGVHCSLAECSLPSQSLNRRLFRTSDARILTERRWLRKQIYNQSTSLY